MISGRVTHPVDLGPAIAKLPEEARKRMEFRLKGAKPTPKDIAQAADWYREKYGHE